MGDEYRPFIQRYPLPDMQRASLRELVIYSINGMIHLDECFDPIRRRIEEHEVRLDGMDEASVQRALNRAARVGAAQERARLTGIVTGALKEMKSVGYVGIMAFLGGGVFYLILQVVALLRSL